MYIINFQDIDIRDFLLVDLESVGEKNGLNIDNGNNDDEQSNEYSTTPKKKKRGKNKNKKKCN